jgi:hypothetical protein
MRPAIQLSKLTLTAAITTLLATGCPDGKDDPVDTGDSYAEIFDDDHDGYTTLEDCDDSDPDVHPGALEVCDGKDNDCDGLTDDEDDEVRDPPSWYADGDADGYGDPGATHESCEAPSGYVDVEGDCDDANPDIHPDADERCDGIDNDCDELIDDDDDSVADASTWYADSDGDGYGDPDNSQQACELPSGFLADDGDCDDSDATVNPDAEELCDNIDNDCDGDIDDADDELDEGAYWYLDSDADGYGDPDLSVRACMQPSGYIAEGDDCDDTDAAVNPAATEICDAVDNDCDGDTDEDDATDATTWYADSDADGYGDASSSSVACTAPSGFIADDTDCDDGDATIFPGADEYCDSVDSDCDGRTDDGDELDLGTWYADADADGYGDAGSNLLSCDSQSGYVADDTDCDDGDATIFPGADEYCDGIDNDCDGDIDEDDAIDTLDQYEDRDGDGFGGALGGSWCEQLSAYVLDSSDCDDLDATVYPGADEYCDSVDSDCDGSTDDGDELDRSTWYADADTDGYGDASSTLLSCDLQSGYVADDTDCDDGDAAINHAATEVCDSVDNDCDGLVDDDDASLDTSTVSTWYADSDGDGYGDASATAMTCAQPSGYGSDDTDCDDGDAAINPAATEICDSVDNDCDGDIDDDDSGLDTSTATTWYADSDGDGYGDASAMATTCAQPSGYGSDDTDCDDGDAAINPAATEICDSVDNDCDGDIDDDDSSLDASTATTWYTDGDGDGYGDATSSALACSTPSGFIADDTDCDDGDAAVNPGATEICDSVDNDCDGDIDDDDASLDTSTASTWYADDDGDGYGDAASSALTCSQPTGHVSDDTDCDDGDAAINPAATEICDSVDNDCDGDIDDDDASLDTSTASTWYADSDGDGYGDAASSALACSAPSGFVADDTDCDDADAAYYPSAGGLCALGTSCDDLLSQGYTSDGVYLIAPDGVGAGEHSFEAYCDQSTDGGGWTLLLSADGNSSYWGNNSSNWWSAGSDAAPSALTDADYHGPAYDQLPTDETRICYGDTAHCYSFVHGYGISLFDFFDGDITWTEYSYLSVGHSDVGSDTLRTDYLAALGLTAWSTACYWLGINDTESISAIGLLGDSNGGCSHLGGTYPYHDDLAVGVGLQSCWDANGCSNGGSGHLAGRSRGIGGTDNSGVYTPWFVFGR